MHALGDHIAQGIIHKAMSRHPGQASQLHADDLHPEVRAFARAGMAGMQVAFIDDFQVLQRRTLSIWAAETPLMACP